MYNIVNVRGSLRGMLDVIFHCDIRPSFVLSCSICGPMEKSVKIMARSMRVLDVSDNLENKSSYGHSVDANKRSSDCSF